jgi:hypothetical protein
MNNNQEEQTPLAFELARELSEQEVNAIAGGVYTFPEEPQGLPPRDWRR